MGKVAYVTATGRFREWVRYGIPPSYDAAVHTLRDEPECPPDGTFWNGSGWVPLPPLTNAEKDAILTALTQSLEGKAILAVANALIQKGTLTMADIKTEWRALT